MLKSDTRPIRVRRLFITTMTSASSNVVFDDIFTVNAIDKEGKKFDRGSFPICIVDT